MRHVPGARRRRPKLCSACGAPASWAVEELRPVVVLKRTGQRIEHQSPVRSFWCSDHVPAQR